MDYNEMLFAHRVRLEALEVLQKRHPDGLTDQELDVEIDETVRAIIRSTEGIAKRIRRIRAG